MLLNSKFDFYSFIACLVFENREKMVLVMEFAAGGELYDYLSERKVLSEEEARRVFRQISTAVYYCHKHKICHRDLKLENILLDENGNAKVRSTHLIFFKFKFNFMPRYYYYTAEFDLIALCRFCCIHIFVYFFFI